MTRRIRLHFLELSNSKSYLLNNSIWQFCVSVSMTVHPEHCTLNTEHYLNIYLGQKEKRTRPLMNVESFWYNIQKKHSTKRVNIHNVMWRKILDCKPDRIPLMICYCKVLSVFSCFPLYSINWWTNFSKWKWLTLYHTSCNALFTSRIHHLKVKHIRKCFALVLLHTGSVLIRSINIQESRTASC